MGRFILSLTVVAILGLAALPGRADEKAHRVVFQIDTADVAIMNLTLNNATNVIDYYRNNHEAVEVDIVAFGPGLNMYRSDKSGVADRIKHLAEYGLPSKVQFSACNNTKTAMEKAEGHPITLLSEATLVPSGVVQIMQRQEQGWSYVRP